MVNAFSISKEFGFGLITTPIEVCILFVYVFNSNNLCMDIRYVCKIDRKAMWQILQMHRLGGKLLLLYGKLLMCKDG